MSEKALTGVAAELLRDFEHNGGRPRLTDEKLEAWARRFVAGVDAPKDVAAELVAFTAKLVRDVGDAAGEAVGQLLALAGLLLRDMGAASALFKAAGVDVSASAAKATGFVSSKIPVGAQGRAPGAVSPLGTRFAGHKTKGKRR